MDGTSPTTEVVVPPVGASFAVPGSDTDVDVVVVCFGSPAALVGALDAVRVAVGGLTVSVQVSDNRPGDGTADVVRAAHPDVVLHDMGGNTGFAVAVNRGLAGARGRYALLLNPDTVVDPSVLTRLVEFAGDHPDAGVVAPRLVHADGSDQRTARSFPTVAAGLFGRRSLLTRLLPGNRWSRSYLGPRVGSDDAPRTVDWVSGAVMLVPRMARERVGLLDEGFFLFWEDADWCRRMHDAGLEVWCVPAARVVHAEGGTRDQGWSPDTLRWFHAGAYRYWVKHHAPSPYNPGRWLAALLLSARALVLTAGIRARRPHPRTALEPQP